VKTETTPAWRVMAFSFRQIQYFVAVAENGALSRAAHELAISQSTVTESIRELENDLGFPLFDRHSSGVELTLKGHQFLRHARRILSEIADARRALRDDAALLDGRLALGVTPLVASYVLSDLLARFRRAFPAVSVDIVEDSRDYLEHLLVGGELDVAVVLSGAEKTGPACGPRWRSGRDPWRRRAASSQRAPASPSCRTSPTAPGLSRATRSRPAISPRNCPPSRSRSCGGEARPSAPRPPAS
jgi:DNA-binding transcriptional LysR family regulator